MDKLSKCVLNDLYIYQKTNNIRNECFSLVLVYADVINTYVDSYAKPISGVVHWCDNQNNHYFTSHCWVIQNNKIIDPSYDVKSVEYKKTYYKSVKKLFEMFDIETDKKKKIITQVVNFNKSLDDAMKNTNKTTEQYKKALPCVCKYYPNNSMIIN